MSKEPSIQHIIYKSNYPISIYLLIFLPILITLLTVLYRANFFALLIYLPIFVIIFYIFFSRYAARVEINNKFEMKVYYFFPWNKNFSINLSVIKSFDYARGFYDPFDDRRLGYFGFLRRCYDLIMLSANDRNIQEEYKVNFIMGAFKKVINILNKEAKIDLIKLKSSENIIW
ncbi:hypothetical protein GCM10022289_06370 [Pedobacter jeongneungensis]|uniref:Uncharacterized protein n=1 Tax=Pedobacter jeongneungensis TaxID=947309 RepID=A0ABP8B4T0_9SPHI